MEYYTKTPPVLRLSDMAETLVGSEIIKLAAKIKSLEQRGNFVYNYTIGDFDPELFPLPEKLTELIVEAYQSNQTNYPPSNGVFDLRASVSRFLHTRLGLEYNEDQILVSSGSRPLIYAAYKAILDPGDTVVFPIPSWNNNHYCHLMGAKAVKVETKAKDNFMLSKKDIEPYVKEANLLALCSPLNPTGTVFSRQNLEEICALVVKENKQRKDTDKPLYVLFDQVYWMLNHGEHMHFDPVSLCPEIKEYCIYIDGLSKAFSATGVRVGWAYGPQKLVKKMQNILGHIGAWAPKAEQCAVAKYLKDDQSVNAFNQTFKHQLFERLDRLYNGVLALKEKGLPVDVIQPQASIYLSVKINIVGQRLPSGELVENANQITDYLLSEAQIALVPFYAFGSTTHTGWHRLSVGKCKTQDIDAFIDRLAKAIEKLH